MPTLSHEVMTEDLVHPAVLLDRSTLGLTFSDGELPLKWTASANTEFLSHESDGG